MISEDSHGHLWGHHFFFPLNNTISPERNLRNAIDEKEEEPGKAQRKIWIQINDGWKPNGPELPGGVPGMLLESEPCVARLTGRTRSELDPYKKAQVVCHEVEILIDDEGLRRQCYYCLSYEWSTNRSPNRFSDCGGGAYWCKIVRAMVAIRPCHLMVSLQCEKRGRILSTVTKQAWFASKMLYDQKIKPAIFGEDKDRYWVQYRENIYGILRRLVY